MRGEEASYCSTRLSLFLIFFLRKSAGKVPTFFFAFLLICIERIQTGGTQ
jgi:hypothetical protein